MSQENLNASTSGTNAQDLQRYEMFFNQAVVPMFSCDEKGILIEANHALTDLIGDNNLIGSSLFSRISIPGRSTSFIEEIMSPGAVKGLEAVLTRSSGEIRDISINAVTFSENNRIDGIILDITERRQDEEKFKYLAEFDNLITKLSTHFIELPTEEIDQGINFALSAIADFALVDSAFILTFNSPHSMVLDYFVQNNGEPEGIGGHIVDGKTFESIRKLLQSGDVIKVNDIHKTNLISKNQIKDLVNKKMRSFLLVPMLRETDVIGIIGFAFFNKPNNWIDEMETVLKVSSEMFSNALFRKNIDQQVNMLYDSQSKLFSQIAHSLKTPFTVALSNIELLKTVKDDETKEMYIQEAKESIHEASSIVGQLLKVAKMDLFPVGSKLNSVDAKELVAEVFNKGKALLKSHFQGISVEQIGNKFILTQNEPALISGDKNSLAEAILILIDNSFVHSKKVGSIPKVELSTKKKGKYLVISVEDDGHGIPKEEIPKLFNLYYQADKNGGGSGIGLSYCKKIVESQGGKITVDSKIGKGTEVKLWLLQAH